MLNRFSEIIKESQNMKFKLGKEHNISLHIDDALIYNDHFTTPFCRLWTHNNKPKSSKKDLRHLD